MPSIHLPSVRLPLLVLALAASFVPSVAAAVPVADVDRKLAMSLPDGVVEALSTRQWAAALKGLSSMDSSRLAAPQRADWAFLVGWCQIHGGEPAKALEMLPLMSGAATAPPAYVALVRGEALLAAGQPGEALGELMSVPEGSAIWPRAAAQQAEALNGLARTKEAREVWARLIARPDPADGSPEALFALAQATGVGSDESGVLLRRLWASYATHPLANDAKKLIDKTPGYKPTLDDISKHAEGQMYAGRYDTALSITEPYAAKATEGGEAGCRVLYVRGRSHYKKNNLSNSVAAFGPIGEACKGVEDDYGPRGLYLVGTTEHRRKRYTQSADAYKLLRTQWPEHTMADDALTRGGISLQEGGNLDEARRWWEEGLQAYPDGDTIPEATWRLAFSLYLDGRTPEAIQIAKRLAALDPAGDAMHVEAGKYWSARWLLYPDHTAPTRPVDDADARQAAVDGFAALCREEPHSYYALLAYGRLLELAPAVAAKVAQRGPNHQTGADRVPWEVREQMAQSPSIQAGVSLARLGLIQEARGEWANFTDDFTPDEKAWLTELRIATGDWLLAHDDLRDWILTHPIGRLGPHEAQVLFTAYPDRYWAEVQAAVKDGYRYEARLFHGLVREESNFNRKIVSFADARGLSQLMPATAKQTAGWLSMSISMDDLYDPITNLTIGAKYLDVMHKQLSDSPYLALAAYNGGAGNVNKWITENGNLPTDEYVELIPYRETRGYVKRVTGTWQTMRYRFDLDSPMFPDLSQYNHKAKP